MTVAIILAGGLGTRLRSVVSDVPKPMAAIRGRPFLEHQMDYWIGQGVNSFVLSVGYMKDLVIGHFGHGYKGIPVSYAVEDEPLGTGGGLLLAAKGMDQPFLVLNGDTFFEVDLGELRRFHDARRSDWTFCLFRSNEAGRYMGIDVDEDGRILSLKSGKGEPNCLANGGVYLIDPSAMLRAHFSGGSKLSLEDELLPDLVAQGAKLCGLEVAGTFIDIGIPDDYLRAGEVLPR